MTSYVEHVNFTVNDIDQTIEFLITAIPDFKLRHREENADRTWAHVGGDTTYLALTSWHKPATGIATAGSSHNHIGLVVDDIEGVRQRLVEAGYPPGFQDGEIVKHPHRLRLYFLDRDHNEYEFVQYLSDDPDERNSYSD